MNIPENYYQEVGDIKTEDYFKDNQFSSNVFKAKYPLNDLEEKYIALCFKRVTDSIASVEKTEELREYWSNRWLYEIYNDWWKPAGSILQGAGNPRKISLSNCTTIEVKGDSLDDIFETGRKISKSAAYRQGLGVDISPLRPKNSIINNSARFSNEGSIGWMKWFDNIGNHVGQRGRIPAMLFSIIISHPDVIDFIHAKSNLHAVQNANISVQIFDSFMEAFEKDENWLLHFTVEDTGEKIEIDVKAKELMKMIAEEACEFAEPGVQFIDTCKRESVTEVLGFPVKSTNACSEKVMYPDSTCVLLSINVGKFKAKNYEEDLDEISQSCTRFLDNVVEYELRYNKTPYKEQALVISYLREIGCGITNLHGWLLKQDLAYDEDKAIKKSEEFIKKYSYYCWRTSIALGNEKGNCLAFDKEKVKLSPFIQRMMNEFPDLKFETLRNSQVMSIAPTGTLSLMFSKAIISTGVEPTIGYYYWKRTRVTGKYVWYFVVPNFVREYLKSNGINLPFEGESVEDNSGEIGEKCQKIIDKHYDPELFKPAHKIDPFKKVELMSKFAKWIDSSMSVTYNIPENSTYETVQDIYYKAWKSGIKSIAIYRDKSREGIIEFESPKLVAKRFKKDETLHLERPDILKSRNHHVKVEGKKYLVIIGFLNNKPYEVFAGEQKEVEIPIKYKFGLIEKVASKKYNLYASEEEVEKLEEDGFLKVRDIIKQFNNDKYSDLTRLLSTNLRYNVPLAIIIDQLDKAESDITSFSKAISRVLKNYLDEDIQIEDLCPECHNPSLVNDSACIKCVTDGCGYSRCT